MNVLTGIYCLIFALLCISNSGFSQNSAKTVVYADTQGIELEILEMERSLFNNDVSLNETEVLISMAYAYKNIGNYKASLRTLERINANDREYENYCVVVYEKMLLNYLTADYSRAYFNSDILLDDCKDLDTSMLINTLLVQLFIHADKMEFNSSDSILNELYQLKAFNTEPAEMLFPLDRIKNPQSISTMSYFIPGLGQLLAGSLKNGLSGFFLTGASVYFTYYSFLSGHYACSVLSGLPLIFRFYIGGVKNARTLVNDFNKRMIENYKTKILNNLKTSL